MDEKQSLSYQAQWEQLYYSSQYGKAMEFFNKILASCPDNLWAIHFKWRILSRLWKHEEALSEFDKISALEDMSTDMTQCWLRLKRYDKIREMYDSETGEMKTESPCFVGKDVWRKWNFWRLNHIDGLDADAVKFFWNKSEYSGSKVFAISASLPDPIMIDWQRYESPRYDEDSRNPDKSEYYRLRHVDLCRFHFRGQTIVMSQKNYDRETDFRANTNPSVRDLGGLEEIFPHSLLSYDEENHFLPFDLDKGFRKGNDLIFEVKWKKDTETDIYNSTQYSTYEYYFVFDLEKMRGEFLYFSKSETDS